MTKGFPQEHPVDTVSLEKAIKLLEKRETLHFKELWQWFKLRAIIERDKLYLPNL